MPKDKSRPDNGQKSQNGDRKDQDQLPWWKKLDPRALSVRGVWKDPAWGSM